MKTLSKVFSYDGSAITFSKGDSVMVNATEMAKPFNKVTKDWLRTKQSQEFIASLSAVRQISPTDLVLIKQGGNGEQGTWMHEDVALEFARWLSPAFAIWCNDRIKELLTTGVATLADDDATIAQAMAILQKRLDKANADKAHLEADNQQKQATIEAQTSELKKQAPKVEYYDQTLQSVNTLTATQVAKERGMDAEKLNKRLKEAGIIYRQSGQWIVKQPYASWGLHKTRTQTFTRSDGSLGTNTYLVWTQRGKMFILALADNDFKVKDAVRQIKGAAATAKTQKP